MFRAKALHRRTMQGELATKCRDLGEPMSRWLKNLWRYAWASPNTLLGLAAAIASFSLPRAEGSIGICCSDRGFARWFLSRRGYCAATFGHLVLMTGQPSLETLTHEMVHVRQAERWGPLFIPAYLAVMLALRLRSRHPYWDHPFEVEARQLGRSSIPRNHMA